MNIQALLWITADTKTTQDLVTLVPWTFIIQICNLFLQVFLIKKFLFKPINEILEKRKNLAFSFQKPSHFGSFISLSAENTFFCLAEQGDTCHPAGCSR